MTEVPNDLLLDKERDIFSRRWLLLSALLRYPDPELQSIIMHRFGVRGIYFIPGNKKQEAYVLRIQCGTADFTEALSRVPNIEESELEELTPDSENYNGLAAGEVFATNNNSELVVMYTAGEVLKKGPWLLAEQSISSQQIETWNFFREFYMAAEAQAALET